MEAITPNCDNNYFVATFVAAQSGSSDDSIQEAKGFGFGTGLFGGPGKNLEEFITQDNEGLESAGFFGKEVISAIKPKLTGNVAAWFSHWLGGRGGRATWTELQSALRRYYQEPEYQTLRRLKKFKFEVGSDFEEFIWSYREVLLRWKPSFSERKIVRAVLRTLPREIMWLFPAE